MEDVKKVPDALVEVLRYLSLSPEVDFSNLPMVDDSYIRSALEILQGLPNTDGEISRKESVLSSINNPNKETREYINENKALLKAFPILKHIYGFVDNKKELQKNIDLHTEMFGSDAIANLPEYLKPTPISSEVEALIKAGAVNRGEEEDRKEMRSFPVSEKQALPYHQDAATDYTDYGDIGEPPSDIQTSTVSDPASEKQGFAYHQDAATDDGDIGKPPSDPVDKEQNLAYHQDATKWTPPEQTGWVPSGWKEVPYQKEKVRPEPVDLDREPMHHEQREHARTLRGDIKPYDPEAAAQRRREEERDDWSYMREGDKEFHKTGGFVGYANGGGVPVGEDELNAGFVGTPPEAAIDQAEAAQNGQMGGDKVETEVPEGSYVLNSYAVELAGIKDIEKLIADAKKFYVETQETEGIVQEPLAEDVEVRVSEGEYIIPPALVKIIGRDRLEKINKRGIAEFERQQAEVYEGEQQMSPEGFMPPEEAGIGMGAGEAPMQPEQVPQGFAFGGGVPQQGIGGNPLQPPQPTQIQQAQKQGVTGPEIGITNQTLQMALMAKLPSDPKPKQQKVVQAAKPKKIGTPTVAKTTSPLTRVNPLSPGAQNLQNPNVAVANMGGFIPYSRNG